MPDETGSVSKATIALPDGTKVTVEGTVDAIAAMLGRVADNSCASGQPGRRTSKRHAGTAAPSKGPVDHIRELVAADFFKTKRGLGDVQKKLEEGAHIYPVTSLSPALFRLVRMRELGRVKEASVWKYVNP